MTDKMFADILCRSLLEIGNAIIRMVRAVEKKYELPPHNAPRIFDSDINDV